MWVRILTSPKNRYKDGPIDGRKIMKDNKDSQMGQVTPKKYTVKSSQILQITCLDCLHLVMIGPC